MNAIDKMKIYNKLDITDEELERFRTLKNNYNITDILFIRNNKKYRIIIDYDINNISKLFKKEIEKNELFYTLKVGNKIILKNVYKKDIKTWLRYNLDIKEV